MKKIVFYFLVSLTFPAISQTTISPQLIASAGGSGVVGSTYYDFSVGEPYIAWGGTSNGCDSIFAGFQHCAQDTLNIIKNTATTSGGTTICSNSNVVLTAPIGSSWHWYPGAQTTQTISVNTSGVYHVRTTNSCNDTILSYPISVTVLQPPTPQICMVSSDSIVISDSTRYNIIFWDKTPYQNVDSFVVYRETSTNIYSRIAAVPYTALSYFVDTSRSVGPANGNPMIGSYLYRITAIDTCGAESAPSKWHKSLSFLDLHNGSFSWNLYDVEASISPVTNFNLMRDNNNTGVWSFVGSVTGSNNTANDPSYFTYQNQANWRVDALGFNCTPTMLMGNNTTQGAVVKSRSNVRNNRTTRVNAHNSGMVSIYPSPSGGLFHFEIASALQGGTVEIYNALGEKITSEKVSDLAFTLDISKHAAGVYQVLVLNKGVIVHQTKIVKQ